MEWYQHHFISYFVKGGKKLAFCFWKKHKLHHHHHHRIILDVVFLCNKNCMRFLPPHTLIAKFLGCKGSHKLRSPEILSAEVVGAEKGRNPGDPLKVKTVWEEALRKSELGPPGNRFKSH